MEYNVKKKEIVVDKELNNLDKFVLDFMEIIGQYVDYVIISGYVSILLGRSRGTEDVDMFIPKLSFDQFQKVFDDVIKRFECMNASNAQGAFSLLEENIALRFFYEGVPVPNIELKFVKTNLDKFALENRIKVIINEKKLFISPLELQIAFKLFLGSDKDFEDAKHLYSLFANQLDNESLNLFVDKLSVHKSFGRLKKDE